MELFVDQTHPSTFLFELIISYLHLTQKNKIVLIKISKGAQLALTTGALKLMVPSLVTSSGEVIAQPQAIARYLLSVLPQWQDFFLGSTLGERQEIKNIKSILKEGKELRKGLNKYLQSRTFCVGSHLTLADFIIFTSIFDNILDLTDQQKGQYCHITRWFRHIQNLPDIEAYLKSKNLPLLAAIQPKIPFLQEKKSKAKKEVKEKNEVEEPQGKAKEVNESQNKFIAALNIKRVVSSEQMRIDDP